MPKKRYIGAFGVTGWATRSGSGLLSYGEPVEIDRYTPKQPATSTVRMKRNQKHDIVVRFKNDRGQEVGRLENEDAAWVSTLLDQNVCVLEGTCVFTNERLRTNDSIYLQLRCYLAKSAFDSGSFRPLEGNRNANFYEAKESPDERKLRLRQVALVKLFDQINLHPTRVNATTEQHKRQGLLKQAENAEERTSQGTSKTVKSPDNNASSPPSDENEEGEELEQDQLDTLYKKAQSFDFNTPEAEPAESFAMSLRKYQKQALFWMMGKEKDEKAENKEQSMHPLWEEYAWPSKDVDDNELPDVADQPNFYVNPYSGEMSLEFPVQEQNCLGGILADGESFNTCEGLLLTRFRNGAWENNRNVKLNPFAYSRTGSSHVQRLRRPLLLPQEAEG